MNHDNQVNTNIEQPQITQDELSTAELDTVTGGGIKVPDKTPKGGFSWSMSQSINFAKPGQDKSIIGVL